MSEEEMMGMGRGLASQVHIRTPISFASISGREVSTSGDSLLILGGLNRHLVLPSQEESLLLLDLETLKWEVVAR